MWETECGRDRECERAWERMSVGELGRERESVGERAWESVGRESECVGERVSVWERECVGERVSVWERE